MKKIYLLFCALTAAMGSFAQTVPGGDMEIWRSNTSGTSTAIGVQCPASWFGSDSTFIGLGQTFGALLPTPIPDDAWHAQLFEESNPTYVHGGSHSAKIMSTFQDTLLFAGTMSNSQANVHIIFTAPYITGVSFLGGLLTTDRPMSVSAWTQYYPGKDSITHLFGGHDTALLTVTAISRVGGTIGTGIALIGPSSSWTQITANVVYTDTLSTADTFRITFASSGGATQTLDSSILYVDDVTMTSRPQVSHEAVKNVVANNAIKVYPNPATNTIFFDGAQSAGLTCTLLSASGQVAATKVLTGKDALDVSELAGGMYFYTIKDNSGTTIQKGNVTLNR